MAALAASWNWETRTPMKQVRYRGTSLEYLTVYPDAYDVQEAYPLIICLHGYGANMEDLTSLASALDPGGYLYVFPNGPLPPFNGADFRMRTWYERGGNESYEAVHFALQTLDGFIQ